MMPGESGDHDQVDLAINRVLQAEREAREAVARCRREALQSLEAAREQARRIRRRVDQRLILVQKRAEAGVERALSAGRSGGRRTDAAAFPSREQQQRLEAAIEALAAEMT